jgi:dipeptidyl aminopeptidase/acylaminoacyl peptidase
MVVLDAEPFLHGGIAKNPIYSPNGHQLCLICNYGGVTQMLKLDRTKRQPAQPSFIEEGITFIDYINGTDHMVIGMDATGKEMEQLFLLTADNHLISLTNSPEYIHRYGGSSPDGKWIAWSSNRHHPSYLDVYIQNLETLEIRLVYSGNGSFTALQWSPDGTSLLVQQKHTFLDNDLGILDLASGKMNWITEHKGEASYKDPQFSQNGKFLYVLTNKDREFLGLALIEISTKKLMWLQRGAWDFENLTINEDKTKLAFTENQGGISKGFILDLYQNALFTWTIPKGVISHLSFSPDRKKLGYEFSGPAHPSDIWELDLYTMQAYRVTHLSESSTQRHRFIEPYTISYPSFDNLMIPAFYYKPIQPTDNHPVIIYIHGGPESQIRASYSSVIQYFLSEGFAICAPNIRGSTGYGKTYTHLDDVRKRMDAVKDLVYLVKWLKRYGGIDPSKVVVMGSSYGGFMTLAAISHFPSLWSAAIAISGFPSIKTFLQTTNPLRKKLREAEYGTIEDDGEFFARVDPVHHTDKIMTPLMVIHGANDSRVSVKDIETMVDLLRRRNHPVQFIRFEDEGHSIAKRENKSFAYRATVDFLKYFLGR